MIKIIKSDPEYSTEAEFDNDYIIHRDIYEMLYEHKYVIAVSCYNGAHFFSQPIEYEDELKNELNKYEATCIFFDGGQVNVYEYNSIGEVELVYTNWV